MSCIDIRATLSRYIDGEMPVGERVAVLRHLEGCSACLGREMELRRLGSALRRVGTPPTPEGLALRLRVSASRFAARKETRVVRVLRAWAYLRSLMLPAAAGMLAGTLLLMLMVNSAGEVRLPAESDVRAGASSPPELNSASSFALGSVGAPLLIEANVDARGRVYDFHVLAGTATPAVLNRLRDRLLLSVFAPATTALGEPTNGSALLDLASVRVRG